MCIYNNVGDNNFRVVLFSGLREENHVQYTRHFLRWNTPHGAECLSEQRVRCTEHYIRIY